MYQIDHHSLIFSGGKRCHFAGDISEILTFDGALVVRLADNPISILRNIFGVDYRGTILWQIPAPVSFTLQRPYVRISDNNGRVDALNWDGHVLTLQPKSGIIMHETYCANDTGFSSRRVAPARHWM